MTGYVELVRNLKLGGMAVCRRQKRGEHVASPERLPVQIAIAGCKTRFRHLHRRDMAQALLNTGWHQAWIAAKAPDLILVREQCEQSTGN